MNRRTTLDGILVPIISVLCALALASLIIASTGNHPIVALKAMLKGSLGSRIGIGQTLSMTIPLALAGLGVSVAGHARVFNMGAEGQLMMGALGTVLVAQLLPASLSAAVMLPLAFVGGFLGGALWGAIPGVLRAKYRVNEVVLTLMLNEIALLFVNWVVRGPLHEQGGILPHTAPIPAGARLPALLKGTRLHWGFALVFLVPSLLCLLLNHTTFGFAIRAVGSNDTAARASGINVTKTMLIAMLLSGGLAGLAGFAEVSGVHWRLMDGISAGLGYTAIVVSLLGKRNPVGVVFSAFLFALLLTGADSLQRTMGLSMHLANIIMGLIILCLLAGEYLATTGGSLVSLLPSRQKLARSVR